MLQKRSHTCPVCGRVKPVNALGRIKPHDVPKRRGRRCNGGGFKVAEFRHESDTKRFLPPN